MTASLGRPADRDPDLVRLQAGVGVDHAGLVHAEDARLDVRRERLVADRDRDAEVLPRAAGVPLDAEDRALAAGVDAGQVEALHRADRRGTRRERDLLA